MGPYEIQGSLKRDLLSNTLQYYNLLRGHCGLYCLALGLDALTHNMCSVMCEQPGC